MVALFAHDSRFGMSRFMTRRDLPLARALPHTERIRSRMNVYNFLAGIVIIIAGVLLFSAGPQMIMIPTTEMQTVPLFHDNSFVVGDVWEASVQLEKGIRVNGTLAISSALTSEPSEVLMLVTDEANYPKWTAHDNPAFIYEKQMSNGQAFTFSIANTGIYHIILDNTSSPVKKKVTLNAELLKEIVINVPDDRVRYAAYGVIACGLFVTAIGVLRKTQVPWA